MSIPHQNDLQGISLHFGLRCTKQAANLWHEANIRSIWFFWGGYTFGHWPGAVHSERAEKVSHTLEPHNGERLSWAIYAAEWFRAPQQLLAAVLVFDHLKLT